MKKGVVLLLALVLLPSIVSAASYDLDSFNNQDMQGIVVGQNDEVRFKLLNGTHTVVFSKVTDVGFRFTGYGFLKDEYSFNGFATEKWSSHVDINHDNVSDMIIAFYGSEKDKKTNETYVTVIFKLPENKAPITTQATGVPQGVRTESSYKKYLTPVGVVAFILVLVLVARKTRNKEKVEPKEKVAGETEEN